MSSWFFPFLPSQGVITPVWPMLPLPARGFLATHYPVFVPPPVELPPPPILLSAIEPPSVAKESRPTSNPRRVRNYFAECSICHKIFKRKGSLQDHMRGAHSNVRFVCPVVSCGAAHTSTRLLHSHFRRAHPGLFPGILCNVCDRPVAERGFQRTQPTAGGCKSDHAFCVRECECGRFAPTQDALEVHRASDQCPLNYKSKEQ